jgi:hypothetical protein
LARGKTSTSRWDWYLDKRAQEDRYNLLRETIRSISDKDLATLASANKSTYEIEAPIRDAIIDELIERRILKHE